MTRRPDITNWLPPPGYGRGRVAAIIEAATGRSPLGPCHLRVLREQRARMVAEVKILFGNGGRRTKKPRRSTLASVAKQVSKAAIAVARYEIKPDGTIVIVTGQGEQQQGTELDHWIAKHARAPERH